MNSSMKVFFPLDYCFNDCVIIGMNWVWRNTSIFNIDFIGQWQYLLSYRNFLFSFSDALILDQTFQLWSGWQIHVWRKGVHLSLFILTSAGFPQERICPTKFSVKLFREMLKKLDCTGKEINFCILPRNDLAVEKSIWAWLLLQTKSIEFNKSKQHCFNI